MRVLVSDNTSIETYYGSTIPSNAIPITDYHDKLEPSGAVDFSGFSFTDYITSIMYMTPTGRKYGIIISKGDSEIQVYEEEILSGSEVVNHLYGYVGTGHATDSCRDNVIAAVDGDVALSDIYIYNRSVSLSGFMNVMVKGGFDIASRSYAGFNDSMFETTGDRFETNGKGLVYAHHHNHDPLIDDRTTATTRLDVVCLVGSSKTGAVGSDTGHSYGPGLEFYVDIKTSESRATAYVAGLIAKLMVNHATENFHDARQRLRQSGSNWDTGWIEKGGFGYVDYDIANAVTLGIGSPIRKDYTNETNKVTFEWMNNPQSTFSKTIIARFDSEPARTAVPTDGTIIYSGTDEEYEYNHNLNGDYWFVFFSQDTSGAYSKVEDNDSIENVEGFWFDKVSILLEYVSSDPPTVNAGDDQSEHNSQTISLVGEATYYSSLLWSTSGDGSFSSPTSLTTNYTFGENDLLLGTVNLCLTAQPIPPYPDSAQDCLTATVSIDRFPPMNTIVSQRKVQSTFLQRGNEYILKLTPVIKSTVANIQSVSTLVSINNSSNLIYEPLDTEIINRKISSSFEEEYKRG